MKEKGVFFILGRWHPLSTRRTHTNHFLLLPLAPPTNEPPSSFPHPFFVASSLGRLLPHRLTQNPSRSSLLLAPTAVPFSRPPHTESLATIPIPSARPPPRSHQASHLLPRIASSNDHDRPVPSRSLSLDPSRAPCTDRAASPLSSSPPSQSSAAHTHLHSHPLISFSSARITIAPLLSSSLHPFPPLTGAARTPRPRPLPFPLHPRLPDQPLSSSPPTLTKH